MYKNFNLLPNVKLYLYNVYLDDNILVTKVIILKFEKF